MSTWGCSYVNACGLYLFLHVYTYMFMCSQLFVYSCMCECTFIQVCTHIYETSHFMTLYKIFQIHPVYFLSQIHLFLQWTLVPVLEDGIETWSETEPWDKVNLSFSLQNSFSDCLIQVGMYICTRASASGGQRTICGNWCSPSRVWTPHRSSGLMVSTISH